MAAKVRNALGSAALLGLLLSGCSSDSAGTKAGGEGPPLTLRLGTDDEPGRRAADQIADFARRVDELSDGRVSIKPVWHAAGDTGGDDWDQKVARLVAKGELDMGLIPSRAWDTEGVDTLRPLNTPFLLTSNAVTATVVDDPVADQMLAGLESVGVHGLALLPESMRYLFTFSEPIVTAAGFDHALVRAPASDTVYATFRAVGAIPGDTSANDDALRAGLVDAAESELGLAHTFPRFPLYATGNLPLWPKVNALVVNATTFEGLPIETQDLLQTAATQSRDWSVESLPHPATEAKTYCERGGTVVHADDAALKTIRAAVSPVRDGLEADPVTESIVAAIAALADSTGAHPDVVEQCTASAPPSAEPAPDAPAPGEHAAFPNGTYRAHVTAETLEAAGLPAQDVANYAGVWTLTFRDGAVSEKDVNDATGAVSRDDGGVYCASATRISIGILDFAPPGQDVECGNFWTARWSLTDDQVRFSDIHTSERPETLVQTLFGATPWTRIE